MSEHTPLWSKNFILVSAINFQLVLTFYLLVVVIVGYAVAELGATTAQAGLVSGLFIVGTLIGRLLVGQFLQRFGQKTTMIVGLIGFLIFSGFYFIPMNITALLGVRFMHGFMMGMASTVLGTIIAQILPPTRRGEGIGYYSMSSTLGTAIGPFLAIWMMLHVGYSSIFALSSLVAVSCLVVALMIEVPKLPQHTKTVETQVNIKKPGFISQFIEIKALPISIIMLLTSICYSGVLSFINFYAKEIDLVETASFFFLMYAIAILFSRPFTGPLMDRKSENIIMYPAFIIMALALYLLSQAHSPVTLLLCAGLLGLGYGNIQSVCQTVAVKSTTLNRMGFATSTFFIFLDAGLGFGPYFIGMALDYINYAQLYMYSAIAALICIGFYYVLHGHKVKSKAVNAA
ncbi:MFS transporter [Acinetobacter sp. C_4_1]|uniref:MFS transporter n=1 Tax=unclassified Acinetobacter TaxID=196816 RepID=UPI0021B768E8|nr:MULTISPECIES: MFS transporter [unclassified Acinetobacter]MCT8088101.1 MFS transporter [Acinetobacter sp. F_3_1]MCT8097470.1 MFS transporter [Acinetobacter sp. C_3_1]MCT8100563.1 MFS transporter [Acinetobacter sp. C_4_1]MCT8134150.1 MFS transporter [Acinetobacter sp. T_3_1]